MFVGMSVCMPLCSSVCMSVICMSACYRKARLRGNKTPEEYVDEDVCMFVSQFYLSGICSIVCVWFL